ncbi:GAF domain protein [Rhodococcus opacus]|uniref:GAF domain protein n=1 Tax=Rhodococcus opacus TaxID=37919 RepID=A0A1B1K0T5_RHOOP|nr:GAF domain-containing protein [Rhodococcus opacus]ANS26234.1 GAF domain protein [Rhodococcus opacus]
MDSRENGDALGVLADAMVGELSVDSVAVREALDRVAAGPADRAAFAEKVRRHQVELTRLRRRERELGVLFSSARELAELRDIDALLGRLVSRAHEMMGTDVTYLSEFDPATRELNVRKTAGSVTPQFQHLRVPPGMGLASQIADSRAAQWVLRYQDYAEGPHEELIDDAVAAEGIVSILGVPMLSDGRVLGVLFAATRQEYAFTPDEIAVLSALADHASVVLQTASTLEQVRRSEDEARTALDRLTDYLQVRDRSTVVHQELIEAVLVGGGFEQVAGTLATALGRTVTIVDRDLHAVASHPTPAGQVSVQLPPVVLDAVTTSRTTGHCVHVDDPETPIVAAVIAGELYFGAVLVGSGAVELGPVDERTIERAAQVGALLVLQQNAVADADLRARVELVADLLAPAPERRRDLERRVRAQRVTLAALATVVLISVPAENRATAARAATAFVGDRGLVGEHAGVVAVVLATTAPPGLVTELRDYLREMLHGPVLAITTPTAESPDALPTRFESGLRTARLLAALGTTDAAVSTDAYLPYALLFDTDARTLNAFIDETIGPVRAYDGGKGTDLLATLRAFVRNEGSPTKTARALNYHTNTILQRLHRLEMLLGPEWRNDEHLFRISAAVRLDELREQ